MYQKIISFIKKYQKFLAIFIFMMLFLIILYFYQKPDGLLHIIFFDVGEGDGILIKTPKGETVLIDGGPNKQIIYSISNELSIFKREIDIGIVSHSHADHLTGFIEVFRRFYFGSIFINDLEYQTPEVEALKDELEKNNRISRELIAGQNIQMGEISLKAIWPEIGTHCNNDINECSIVLRLDYRDFCVYFMGDVGSKVQGRMENLEQCEIVKIAHQGSKDAIDESFIKRVIPKVGIISVGKNNYGHPNAEILKLLELNKIKIFRTDELGDIEIISDGQQYNVITK